MSPREEDLRQEAIRRYVDGESPKSVYTSLKRSERWFFKWLARYRTAEQDWFCDRSRIPQKVPGRIDVVTEDLVCHIRRELEESHEFCGAQAIRWELEDLGWPRLPSLRTINRILKRRDLIQPRQKRYQPKGKAYPKISAQAPNLLHQLDLMGPRYLSGSIRFYLANVMDIYSHRVAINPLPGRRHDVILAALVATWQRLGIPKYLQMDNQLPLRGSNRYPRSFGKLLRLCLKLGIQPVFIPLREPWRNGQVEKFQDTCQLRFLRRVHMTSFSELLTESRRFENRHNSRYRYSIIKGKTPLQVLEATKFKLRLLPGDYQIPDLKDKPTSGRIHLVRFIRSNRLLDIFSEKFTISEQLVYEYAWSTICVKEQKLRVFLNGNQLHEFKYQLR
jgi:putative transposase